MQVHVLTAVSRPDNLGRVAESLARAAENAPDTEIVWHWRLDTDRTQIGGQALKNQMLDEISDGWVYVLDDDTVMHPDLLARLGEHGEFDALVVMQKRVNGRELAVGVQFITPGFVDIGQAVMRRELIGEHRIPIHYDGDGMFLQAVLGSSQRICFADEVLSFHNALSGVEVSV